MDPTYHNFASQPTMKQLVGEWVNQAEQETVLFGSRKPHAVTSAFDT